MQIKLGTTYSHREIACLEFDHQQAFTELLDWRFDLVRLGAYWGDIQPTPTDLDLSALIWMLDQCQRSGQQVVLTVGMKAPRWPEYYIPDWVSPPTPAGAGPAALPFIERVVTELQQYSCIAAWQVENEPLDPSGTHEWRVPLEVLQAEVALVRSLDPRPIHINVYGLAPWLRRAWSQALPLADTMGLDVYYHVPPPRLAWLLPKHIPFKSPDFALRHLIKHTPKPVWLTELQAEPWERDNAVKFSANPPSMNPELLERNFHRAVNLHPAAIFLWGWEYWYWKKQQGDRGMWDAALRLTHRTTREQDARGA
jgi:hypothetical protein